MDGRVLLERLCSTAGVAGRETLVAGVVAETLSKMEASVETDPLGNVIGHLRGTGNGRRIMVAAHMDEVGLMITSHAGRGFFRFELVGGIDPRILPGLEVIIHGKSSVPGIVATKPPHLIPEKERTRVIPTGDLYIDTGLDETEAREIITPGLTASFRSSLISMLGDAVVSPRLDNRAGVTAMLMAADLAQRYGHQAEIFIVATAQEELGMRGASAAAHRIAPDLGLALDVTYGSTESDPEARTLPLGQGPAVGIGPHLHAAISSRLERVAADLSIPFQREPLPSQTGTDASVMQVSRSGIPVGLVSIPLRYMHSPSEVVKWQDIADSARLVGRFLAGLDDTFWEELNYAAS